MIASNTDIPERITRGIVRRRKNASVKVIVVNKVKGDNKDTK